MPLRRAALQKNERVNAPPEGRGSADAVNRVWSTTPPDHGCTATGVSWPLRAF